MWGGPEATFTQQRHELQFTDKTKGGQREARPLGHPDGRRAPVSRPPQVEGRDWLNWRTGQTQANDQGGLAQAKHQQ